MYKYMKRVSNIIIPLTISLRLSTESSSESSTYFNVLRRECIAVNRAIRGNARHTGRWRADNSSQILRLWLKMWMNLIKIIVWENADHRNFSMMQTGYENDEILQSHNQIWISYLSFLIESLQRLQECCLMMNFGTKTTATRACIIEFYKHLCVLKRILIINIIKWIIFGSDFSHLRSCNTMHKIAVYDKCSSQQRGKVEHSLKVIMLFFLHSSLVWSMSSARCRWECCGSFVRHPRSRLEEYS